MEKIKLVVWDLDETFWKGTLSEGEIETIPQNIELVKELTNRGIINSIVSKNDFDKVKAKLIEIGIWDYFVFPTVAWKPKGQLLKELIEKAQLRAPNVLFLDDNHSNIEEAKFYNPKLHAAFPDFIDSILAHPAFKGNKDENHTRLKQYKILEEKHTDATNYSNNDDFLKSSNIELYYETDLKKEEERVFDLVERSNQLNYTKIRLKPEELSQLIASTQYEQKLIGVKDKYGDYGIVGYYVYDPKQHQLIHFVLSCRILNLGVEQYIYAKLGYPKLDIVPEVAVELNTTDYPDWINEPKAIDLTSAAAAKHPAAKKLKILFKGGCDLSQMLFYLDKSTSDIIEETNYVATTGMPVHNEHTHLLLQGLKELDDSVAQLPFLDSKTFDTAVFNKDYGVLIYSVLMDYTQEVYKNKATGFLLPVGGYNDLTNTAAEDTILQQYAAKKLNVVDKSFLQYFRENYSHLGKISTDDFKQNLSKIRSLVPANVPIIFINGSELELPGKEAGSKQRHTEMNKALEEFVGSTNNAHLIDVRKYVNRLDNLTDNVRHYKRPVYREIAAEIESVMTGIFGDGQIKTANIGFATKLKDLIADNQVLKETKKLLPKSIKKWLTSKVR
jgi:FkbH-like protein